MKTKTSKTKLLKRNITPTVRTEITIYESDLLEILGMKHVSCNFIREGSATLNEFRGEGYEKRINPEEAKKIIQKWLLENAYLYDLNNVYSRFEVTHHFSSHEDYDGCRHSVYGCTYKLWYDPTTKISI